MAKNPLCASCGRLVDRYNVGVRTATVTLCLACWAAAGYQPRPEASK